MVSSITMYNMWCIILKLQFDIRLWHILHKPVLFNGFTFTLDECNPIIPKRKVNLSSKGTNDMVDGMNVGKGFHCMKVHHVDKSIHYNSFHMVGVYFTIL
jgi:hypothetical protein